MKTLEELDARVEKMFKQLEDWDSINWNWSFGAKIWNMWNGYESTFLVKRYEFK